MAPILAEEGGSEARFRRLETFGFVNGILLLALALLLPALPFSPVVSIPLAAAFLGFGVNALWLRRRCRLALERELGRRKQAEQEARAADGAKGRFLADVSHEIRTPMTGILGMTELLLGSALTPSQREQVGLVRTSAGELLALVDDVLDLARVEAGRLRLRPRDFRLPELLSHVLRLLAPQAGEREVDLRLEIDPGVPDALHGDAVRLRQVLLNLVGNAIRFTRRGAVTVRVEGKAATLCFVVRDTGVGIRPEDQARLFQPFTQSDSAASRHLGGTGLGLAISKSIVELMGGEIGFESTRGVGSTFWFRLPLVRALGSDGVPRQDRRDPHQRRERRVLVVDDRAPSRAVAEALLQDLGYAAETVESGEEALALLAARPFDAVLLDSEMPGLDGRETCRRLRRKEADGRHVPVIALTAHTGEEEHEACRAAGMDDCLVKPLEAAALAALLDRWIGSRAAPGLLEERLAALGALPAGLGPGLRTQVIAAFLKQGEGDLAALRRALLERDAAALTDAAHGLAGSAAVLGAHALAASAGELAVLARQGDLEGSAERLPRVESDFRDAAARMGGG